MEEPVILKSLTNIDWVDIHNFLDKIISIFSLNEYSVTKRDIWYTVIKNPELLSLKTDIKKLMQEIYSSSNNIFKNQVNKFEKNNLENNLNNLKFIVWLIIAELNNLKISYELEYELIKARESSVLKTTEKFVSNSDIVDRLSSNKQYNIFLTLSNELNYLIEIFKVINSYLYTIISKINHG